jgi:hypothetical protein
MLAAQAFNIKQQQPIVAIFGTVTSGTLWRFLKLENQNLTVDLTDYAIAPIEQLLGILHSINQEPRRKRTGYGSRFAPKSQIWIASPGTSPQSGGEYVPYSIQQANDKN